MRYKLVGIIERGIQESFEAEIEATDPQEAQDILYEILSDYPNSEFVAERLLKISSEGFRPSSVAIEFRGQVDEDEYDDEAS